MSDDKSSDKSDDARGRFSLLMNGMIIVQMKLVYTFYPLDATYQHRALERPRAPFFRPSCRFLLRKIWEFDLLRLSVDTGAVI